MRKVRSFVVALAIAALGLPALLTSDASAQPAPAGAEVSARVKRMRVRVLRDKVGLDEARATKVEGILDGFDPARVAAQKEQRAARKALAELVRAKGEDQKAYGDAVQRVRDAQKALAELRGRQLDAVAKELTPREQASLLVALGKLEHKAKARRGAGPRRAPRGR